MIDWIISWFKGSDSGTTSTKTATQPTVQGGGGSFGGGGATGSW